MRGHRLESAPAHLSERVKSKISKAVIAEGVIIGLVVSSFVWLII